jgi:hypothetical protein
MAMPDDSFRARWRTFYGDCPPIGFLLQETFPDRWFRIHSLPTSKRYAETAVELATVLSRHNTVATDLLGHDAACVLVTHPHVNPLASRRPRSGHQLDALGLEPLMVVVEEDPRDADEGWKIPLVAASITWRPTALDDVLADVAEDIVGPLLVVATDTGRVYAPYDGGADLFAASTEERDEFRSRYAEWLSPHPSGL